MTVWRVGGEGFEGIILYLYGSCPGLGDKRRLNLKQEQECTPFRTTDDEGRRTKEEVVG